MSYTTLNLGYTASAGIQYTGTTDTSADWIDVPNETYFFDKETELVYFKDASGNVIAIFESGTSVNIYNTSDSLTGDRVVDLNGNTLTFDATTDATEQLQTNFNSGIRNTIISQDRSQIDFDANITAESNPNANFNITAQQIISHTQSDESTGTNTSDVIQNATLITSNLTDYSGDNVSQINQSSIQINQSVSQNVTDFSNIQLVYNDINQNVTDGTINQQININRDNGITLTSNDGVATQKSIILDSGGVNINSEYILPNTDGSAGQVITTDGAGNLSFTTPSSGSVTSVGLTMPNAFGVANSPVTSSDTINVTALGTASQYIRGDGVLADFPSPTGGGSSVVYYFNGGTNQGTFGGSTYYEMSKTAVFGSQVTFQTIGVDGLLTQFITDALDPNLLEIPSGNWLFGTYFDSNGGTGNPSFYVELLKWDGTTFTSIATNSANPEFITKANGVDVYYSQLGVPQTSLLATDRLAIRFYVTTGGRTITFYTQGTTISQVTTTFSFGLTALNGLTDQVQYFQTGTSGTDFAINSATDIHTFDLPVASATNTGKLSATDWSTFDGKADNNIYTADGTLTANRTLTFTGNNIQFTGTNSSQTIQLLLKASAGSGNRIGQILYLAGTKQIVVGVTSAGAYISNADTGYSHQIGATADGIEINGTYRFPNTDGGVGQVMTTDGAGVLSWANPTSTNIYNSDGTLTGTRVVTLGTNGLRFLGGAGVGSIKFDKIDAGSGASTSYLQTINDISTSVINGTNSSSLSINSVQYESIVTDGTTDTTQFSQQSNQYTFSLVSGLVNRSLDIATSGITINGEYLLPNADGTSGQVLTTNGAGITSWQSVSGTNIYNNDGTLSADRTLTGNAKNLTFDGVNSFSVTTQNVSQQQFSSSILNQVVDGITGFYSNYEQTFSEHKLALYDAGDILINSIQVLSNGVTFNNEYTFPLNDGSSNQVLTTNGAGALSFQNAQSLASVYNTTTKTGASYTAVNRDYVLINASTFVLTLPTASANAQIGVKMINSVVTSIQIKTPSAGVTIDGVDRSSTGLGLFNQYDAYVLICDGTNWWIVS